MNVLYVDENDVIIGAGSRSNAIANGIIVRIARVFLINSKDQLLIQKRSETIDSLPGRWDQSAAGHVDEGEDYDQAATRELLEEVGIKKVKLNKIAKYYTEEKDEQRVKKRFNTIYAGFYDGEVAIDNDEVSDYRWLSLEQLASEMNQAPNDFTEGFIEAFKVYRKASVKD